MIEFLAAVIQGHPDLAGPALEWQSPKCLKMSQFDTNVYNLSAEVNGLNKAISLTDNSHPITIITINSFSNKGIQSMDFPFQERK